MNQRFLKLRFAVVACLVALLCLGASFQSPSIAKSSQIKTSANDQLSNCMSIPGSTLNVLYLIDISQSWGDTDRAVNRAQMISSTLPMFAQLGSEIRKEVKFSYVQFGTEADTKVVQDWQRLTSASASAQAENVRRWTSQHSSAGTNWEAGLRTAFKQIQNARSINPKACFTMVWLTDGTLDLSGATHKAADLDNEFASMNRICNDADRVPYFRDPQNNVTLIGALVNSNQGPPPPYPGGPEVFKLLVSGTGSAVTIGQNKEFDCQLMPGQVPGNFLSKSTVSELRWQFLDLIATLSGLQRADSDVSPSIGRHTAKIQIYVKNYKPGQSLQIIDQNNIDLCAPGQNLCRFNRSGSSTSYWSVEVPNSGPGSVTSAEEWTIKVLPRSETKVFVGIRGRNKNLGIKASDGLNFLNIGEGTSVKGELSIVDESKAVISQSDVESIDFCVDSPRSLRTAGCSANPSLPIDYPAASSDRLFRAHADVKLSGVEKPFRLTISLPIKVLESKAFARLGCSSTESLNGAEYCQLNAIPNRFKTSTSTFTANIEKGSGSVKIVDFHADDLEDRSSAYKFDSDDRFTEVVSGKESELEFQLSNLQAKSPVDRVFGAVSYQSKAVINGQEVVVVLQVPVVFKINQDANLLALILLYIAALLVGIGVPYLLLLMMARSKAKFYTGLDSEFRYITIPVKLDSRGIWMQAAGGAATQFGLQDFTSGIDWKHLEMPKVEQLSRPEPFDSLSKVQIGNATLSISKIRFDAFAAISAHIAVPDHLVITNMGSKSWSLELNESTVELNLNGLIFFSGSSSQIDPLQSDSQPEEGDFPTSNRSELQISKASGELSGSLNLVLLGIQNYTRALTSLHQQLSSKPLQSVNEQLDQLRTQKMIEAESEVQAEDNPSPKSLNGPDKEGKTAKIQYSDFN